jgi:DNA replication protein DnaC
MADGKDMLLRSKLEQLRLPAMGAEFEKPAREAAAANEGCEQYLLRLTELEVAARASNAVQARIRQAGFPVNKDFDTFDFSAVPAVNKPKVLELARAEWIEQRFNVCFIGSPGTGKTHLATALGLAACRQGKRVRFTTAAALVTRLEAAQKQYQLDRVLGQLDKADLLIGDELGYLAFSRAGAELLFQVFADRYERRSLLLTSNGSVQRVGLGVPGGAHDGGVAGSVDAPLPHLRDERRKLPLPGVDEGEEEQEERDDPAREGVAGQNAKGVYKA